MPKAKKKKVLLELAFLLQNFVHQIKFLYVTLCIAIIHFPQIALIFLLTVVNQRSEIHIILISLLYIESPAMCEKLCQMQWGQKESALIAQDQ